METGRVIHGRYLLQRLVKQTPFCGVYQGMDQRLQRIVAVKSVPAPHNMAYKTAMKMTANFSHQHIVGLYDMVVEPETLYMVQEYVEGDPFEKLVQSQLSAFEIAEIGWQSCLALMYAGSSSRRVCHGDLAPATMTRDRQGLIKLNDFALPADTAYFQRWSMLGGEGMPFLEKELAWGQQSEARKADDTRAVGLLLYQLVTASMEPPADGRLRFSRNIPPELCDTIARAIVRQHPQNISVPEELYSQLKNLAEALEPALPTPVAASIYQTEEPMIRQFSPASAGKMATSLPSRDSERSGLGLSSYSGKLASLDAPPATLSNSSPVYAPQGIPGQYNSSQPTEKKSLSTLALLLLGLLAFGLFFIVGYFLGHALIH